METAITLARRYLAAKLVVAPADLVLISAESVTWSDSSLGCPREGMLYMQVLTPGYRITLQHGVNHYSIHTDSGRRAVHCDQPGAPALLD